MLGSPIFGNSHIYYTCNYPSLSGVSIQPLNPDETLKLCGSSLGTLQTISARFLSSPRGVGDYTSSNRPYYVLIMGRKAPLPF